MAVLPTDYTDSVTPTGATTELPATTSRGINAINTQINTNTTALETKGMLAPVQAIANGSETYTIASGSVTQIAGTSINGGYSPAVGDRILVVNAPASTGGGTGFTSGTTQPTNGIYRVTNNTTNLTVTRADDMSGTINPSGFTVFVESREFGWSPNSFWSVTTPASTPATSFTYGTDNIKWKGTGGVAPLLEAIQFSNSTSTITAWNGSGNTVIQPSPSAGTQTINLPTGATTTILGTASAVPAANIPNGISNGNTALQSQVVVSATIYYITGSNLNLPNPMITGLVVGSRFRWRVSMAKTAAGTGIFRIVIYRGTNGSTADTADVTQTIGTQTAVVDSMNFDVEVVITTTGATGGYYWSIVPVTEAITATGFGVATGPTGQFSGTVSSVNLTTASLKFGLGFSATTGTPTITIPLVRAEALNVV